LLVTFCFPTRVFKALALALAEGFIIDLLPKCRDESGTIRIGMSLSKLGTGEIKLSRACIQTSEVWDFKKVTILARATVTYRVPLYPDILEAHLLISWPAGGILEYFIQMLQQKLQSNLLTRFSGWVLESNVFPTRLDLFLRREDSVGHQWVATQTQVKACLFK
jgi:hypothetical protein